MRPSWSGRVGAAYDAELDALTDEVLVVEVGGGVRVGVPTSGADEAAALARAAGSDALDPGWWRTLLGARVVSTIGPAVHLFTDRVPPGRASPLVEQVAAWRLERLRVDAGEQEWRRSGLSREASVFLGRFSEPLEPPAWMERATPAARRVVLSAAASLVDWHGSPADLGVLVHPAYRRRGHGREVAAVATGHAVREGGLARWCLDEADVAAAGLARDLGFEPWGRVLRVRLRP